VVPVGSGRRRDAMTEHASQHVTIQAPPQRCYETVLDVERLSEWAPDIKEARVLARDEDGRPGDVAFRAAAMGRSSSYTLRYTYGSNPLRISWRLVEGDVISRMTGDYEFMPVEGDPDSTLLAYDLDVDLLVRLPGFVKRRLEAKIVHTAIDDLKFRVEAGTRSA
ncbi:MAG TPA: SRPBCC family protein, partial [Acidimicrobiales bacterium]|nr:SRPBCC family protein [Acidimicrobiales bacterium]